MIRAFLTTLLLFTGTVWAAGQDERTGSAGSEKGAVLCVWSIFVHVQQGIELCELEPGPNDAELVDSIERTETFILENTTTGITQQTLDDYKALAREHTIRMFSAQKEVACEEIAMMRGGLGDNIKQNTDELLSVPREPVWNPCL